MSVSTLLKYLESVSAVTKISISVSASVSAISKIFHKHFSFDKKVLFEIVNSRVRIHVRVHITQIFEVCVRVHVRGYKNFDIRVRDLDF